MYPTPQFPLLSTHDTSTFAITSDPNLGTFILTGVYTLFRLSSLSPKSLLLSQDPSQDTALHLVVTSASAPPTASQTALVFHALHGLEEHRWDASDVSVVTTLELWTWRAGHER